MELDSLTLDVSTGGYSLLKGYLKEAKVLATAYKKSEGYYRRLSKWVTYPVIVTSAIGSVCAGIGVSDYALMGLSLTTLILSGFNGAIDPKGKEQRANQFKTEFTEIASNINQFIYENNKSVEEIKTHSQLIHEILNTWKSQAPPVSEEYVKDASLRRVQRLRLSKKQIQELG